MNRWKPKAKVPRSLLRACLWLVISLGQLQAIHASPVIQVQSESSRFVCLPGEKPAISVLIEGYAAALKKATLQYEIYDLGGTLADSGEVSTILNPKEPTRVSLLPNISEVGYYDMRLRLNDGSKQAPFCRWSIVILAKNHEAKKDSAFGFYTLGNDILIQSIVPKGYLRLLKKTGAGYATNDLWWSTIQPAPDEWDWSISDQRFADLKKAGLIPLPHLFGIPQWASSYEEGMPAGGDGHTFELYPPKDLSTWGEFVYRFVERYRDDLEYLRIWNEFDSQYWMGSIPDFAELLKVAYREAHRAKPDIKIVIDTALAKMSFYEALFQLGAGESFDVISIHNYQLEKPLPPEQTMFVEDYRAVMAWRDKRRPGCPVWDSEFCWLAEPWSDPSWLGHGELAQAQYLVRGHILGFSTGLSKMIWFPAYSWPWEVEGRPFQHSGGLLRADMSPRPAYAAYQNLIALLEGSKFNAKMDLPSKTQFGFQFQTDSACIAVLWDIGDEPQWTSFRTTEETLQCIDMLGASTTIRSQEGLISLPLTGSPLYLISSTHLVPEAGQIIFPEFMLNVKTDAKDAASPTVPVYIQLTNSGAASQCYDVNVEEGLSDRGFPMEFVLHQNESVSETGDVLLPSANASGSYPIQIAIRKKGGPVYRIPVSIQCPSTNQPLWRAESGKTPVVFQYSLKKASSIEKLLLTFPDRTAYQFQAEALVKEKKQPAQWITVFKENVGQGTLQIPIHQPIEKIRITFDQMLKFPSLDTAQSFEIKRPFKRDRWQNGSERDYIKISEEVSHSGNASVEIDARGRSKSDPWSNVQQFLPVNDNSYYSISGYAKMPQIEDSWAALYVLGSPELNPHSYTVLSWTDDEWHRLYLTVRTPSQMRELRVSLAVVCNGMAYFDDVMMIPGKIPTDIPEIVSLDLLIRKKKGTLTYID